MDSPRVEVQPNGGLGPVKHPRLVGCAGKNHGRLRHGMAGILNTRQGPQSALTLHSLRKNAWKFIILIGTSQPVSSKPQRNAFVGSPLWTAPEQSQNVLLFGLDKSEPNGNFANLQHPSIPEVGTATKECTLTW